MRDAEMIHTFRTVKKPDYLLLGQQFRYLLMQSFLKYVVRQSMKYDNIERQTGSNDSQQGSYLGPWYSEEEVVNYLTDHALPHPPPASTKLSIPSPYVFFACFTILNIMSSTTF